MNFMIIQFSSFVRKVSGLVAQMGEHKCIQYIHWKASTWQSESDGRKLLNQSLTKVDVRLWIMMCPLAGFGISNIDAASVC
jgi:hypothetical protein